MKIASFIVKFYLRSRILYLNIEWSYVIQDRQRAQVSQKQHEHIILSWKHCALPVITTIALWRLMHLGTWCMSCAQVHELSQSHGGDNREPGGHIIYYIYFLYTYIIYMYILYIYIYKRQNLLKNIFITPQTTLWKNSLPYLLGPIE